MKSKERFLWVNPQFGKIWCTQWELCQRFLLDRRPINNVARHGKPSYMGWSLEA